MNPDKIFNAMQQFDFSHPRYTRIGGVGGIKFYNTHRIKFLSNNVIFLTFKIINKQSGQGVCLVFVYEDKVGVSVR